MDATLPLPTLPAPRVHPLVERAGLDRPALRRDVDESRVDPAIRAKLHKAAHEFEATFVGQMVGTLFEGLEVDDTFGGGHGEEMFRSLLVQEYGKAVTQRGGFGLAAPVYQELLRAQEAANG